MKRRYAESSDLMAGLSFPACFQSVDRLCFTNRGRKLGVEHGASETHGTNGRLAQRLDRLTLRDLRRILDFVVLWGGVVDGLEPYAFYTAKLPIGLAVAGGHTASNAPDLFRPPKLSGAGPG